MMRTAFAGAAIALGMLAGCDDGAPERQTTSIRPANPHADQLKSLSELNRGLGLRRAILATPGGKCKKVDYSGYQQDYGNLSMWISRCSDGNDWALFIAPNGDVQVRSCPDVKTLGLPECRFEAPKPR
jgi:hypothetical protein